MDKDFRAFLESADPDPRPGRPRHRHYNPFHWTVFILLLTGAALATWIGGFYVLGHPEDSRCYGLLEAFHKIEPPKRFEVTAAPLGRFYTAKELYDTYLTLTQPEIDQRNGEFLRNFLRNYSDTKTLVPYVAGRFVTQGAYELKGSDFFPSGVVAVAESKECPQVLIEHVYITRQANVPKVRQMLAMNPDIVLEKKFDLSAIMHVEKLGDGKVLFTVMPLAYGNYAFRQGISSTFRLDPPGSMNLDASLPLVKSDTMQEAVKMFTQYRKTKGLLAKINTPAFSSPQASPPQKASTPAPSRGATQLAFNARIQDAPADSQPETASSSTTTPGQDNAVANAESSGERSVLDQMTPDVPTPAPSQAVISVPPAVKQSQAPQLIKIARQTPAPVAPAPVEKPSTAPAQPEAPQAQEEAQVQAPQQTAPAPVIAPPAKLVQSTPPQPAKPAPPGKVIAQSTPAPVLVAPTPAVGRPIVRASSSPGATPVHIVSAARSPATKPRQKAARAIAVSTPAPAPTSVNYEASSDDSPAWLPLAIARTSAASTPAPVQVVAVDRSARSRPPIMPETASNDGVKLEPFLPPQQERSHPEYEPRQAEQASRSASWRTYSPGQMPRGKLLTWNVAPELADTGVGNGHYYLQGKYVVTASSDGRVVMRPQSEYGESISSVRVVVDYPAGAPLPAEGSRVSRGESRPFQIIDVRRGSDGEVNIYAREVAEKWQAGNTDELLRSYHSQRQRLATQYQTSQ